MQVAEFRSVPDPTERWGSHHLPSKARKVWLEPRGRALWAVTQSPSVLYFEVAFYSPGFCRLWPYRAVEHILFQCFDRHVAEQITGPDATEVDQSRVSLTQNSA